MGIRELLELICPDVYKNIPVTMANHTWGNEFTAAGLWNVWHVDTVSGKQVFEFDEELQSMRMYDMLTMEEAETSIERLRTGYGVKRYVSVDSAEATSPALSDEALAKTAERCSETLDALPRLTGFVLANDGYYSIHTIVKTVDDIRRIADWGVQYRPPSDHLRDAVQSGWLPDRSDPGRTGWTSWWKPASRRIST